MSDETTGLEARIARVEEIAAKLENDRLELDDALRLFEEGIAHLRAAESLLRAGELRVERLLEDADGSIATEPVEDVDA
jgi:exodeoxyribonuclease VII small subunit